MNDFELITSDSELIALCSRLAGERHLAVDLEMDSLHHYREKVCLIQVSSRTGNWLIDPLSIGDLSALAEILGSPDRLIVMHGADYDIRSLYRDFSIEVAHLFDTMIAARLLGVTEFGLAALLKEGFGIVLDKKFQKADWSVRPLSPEMCDYAVADTAHLLSLYDRLHRDLLATQRLGWVEEECNLVRKVRVAEKSGPLFLQCKGASRLKGRQLAVLEELLQMRERHAHRLDRPPFKVIPADALLEAAATPPHSMEELAAVKGITPRLAGRFGSEILSAIVRAESLPADEWPRFPRTKRVEQSEGAKERLKHLKLWREAESSRLGIDPGVLAPNRLLELLAEPEPHLLDVAAVSGMRRWQRALFGCTVMETAASADTP